MTEDATHAQFPDGQPKPFYKRVLLKISGESMVKSEFGIGDEELFAIASEIKEAHETRTQLAIVVGGGNIFRGERLAERGHVARPVADQMGMLGTVLNGLALREMLRFLSVEAVVMSALDVPDVAEKFRRERALTHLEKGRVVIFVAGTGNPYLTTDTAAALRAAEIEAEIILKATKVDAIYDMDPTMHGSRATRLEGIVTFDEVLRRNIKVMDRTAFAFCLERQIPLVVFNMKTRGNIAKVVKGDPEGTMVVANRPTTEELITDYLERHGDANSPQIYQYLKRLGYQNVESAIQKLLDEGGLRRVEVAGEAEWWYSLAEDHAVSASTPSGAVEEK